jgi:hypothetical protein
MPQNHLVRAALLLRQVVARANGRLAGLKDDRVLAVSDVRLGSIKFLTGPAMGKPYAVVMAVDVREDHPVHAAVPGTECFLQAGQEAFVLGPAVPCQDVWCPLDFYITQDVVQVTRRWRHSQNAAFEKQKQFEQEKAFEELRRLAQARESASAPERIRRLEAEVLALREDLADK